MVKINNFLNSHYEEHVDLTEAKNVIYKQCGFDFSNLIKEEESSEYGAYFFDLNSLSVRFRVAKITPTKVGQFVTLALLGLLWVPQYNLL